MGMARAWAVLSMTKRELLRGPSVTLGTKNALSRVGRCPAVLGCNLPGRNSPVSTLYNDTQTVEETSVHLRSCGVLNQKKKGLRKTWASSKISWAE